MSDSITFLKDVYAHHLNQQVMYWRIKEYIKVGPMLEWVIVEKDADMRASVIRENAPTAVAAMKKLQRPDRAVIMNKIDDRLLEQFLGWGWVQVY